jgi:hypothetical protein
VRRIFPLLAALVGCVTDAELEAALDRDRDGYLPVQAGGDDCDETRASVNPGADEVCGDGIDNDCDGMPDDDGIGARVFYLDQDGDGFGDDASESRTACSTPEGYAERAGDCDDQDPARSPAAEDLCDGVDNDCNGLVDEDAVNLLRFRDADGDQFGTEADTIQACQDVPGYVPVGGDCDDTDEATNPAALDGCDGIDRDCNGVVDDDALQTLYFADADGDGAGDATSTVEACSPPPGHVETAGDCDDGDATIRPGALDPCDSIDQDCDGAVDEDASFTTWFRDNDADGLGDADVLLLTCDGAPAQFVADAGDCDDTDPTVTIPTWYADGDGDGHGTNALSSAACQAPTGFAELDDDCDDSNPNASPTLPEICNNHLDDDCNPATDCRLVETLSVLDLPTALTVPSDVDSVTPFPGITGTGPGWVVKRGTSWSYLAESGPSFDGVETPLPCNDQPYSLRDVTGDGRPELGCRGPGTPATVFVVASGSLDIWTSIEVSTSVPGAVLPLESTLIGSGTWVPADSEVRFYPRAGGAPLSEADFSHALACPFPSQVFELFGPSHFVVLGCLVDGSATAHAFYADDLFDAPLLNDAQWTLAGPPTPFGGFGSTYRSGSRAGTSLFLVASSIVSPGLTFDFQMQLFIGPFLDAPMLASTLDPPAGTVSDGWPLGDFDGDGSVDWGFRTETIRVDVAYGGPEVLSLANTSAVILAPTGDTIQIRSVEPIDLDEDGYEDLVVQHERDNGSRTIHVLYGSGQ